MHLQTLLHGINFKSPAKNINLHILIIKLLDAGKTMFKKDYEFDQVFKIFDEVKQNQHNVNARIIS